jgi:hypothetical protein
VTEVEKARRLLRGLPVELPDERTDERRTNKRPRRMDGLVDDRDDDTMGIGMIPARHYDF